MSLGNYSHVLLFIVNKTLISQIYHYKKTYCGHRRAIAEMQIYSVMHKKQDSEFEGRLLFICIKDIFKIFYTIRREIFLLKKIQ